MSLFKKDNQNQKNNKKLLVFITTIFATFTWFLGFLKFKRIRKFVKEQNREIKELKNGEETPKRFFKDSGKLFHDLFIPHEGNDHKPRALRPKSLISYALVVLLVKIGVTGFLFLNYPDPAQLSAIVADRMLTLINQSRVEAGVEPLKTNQLLVQSALAKGQDMLARDYFAHDTPEGKKPWQWIDKNQYDYVYAGENLAIDFKTAEAVQQALMNSPTHRANILNKHYKDVGLAVLNGDFDGRKTILLVEFFGTTRDELSTLADNRPAPAPATAQPSVKPAPVVQQPVPANPAPTQPTPTPTQPVPTPVVNQPANSVSTQPTVAGQEISEVAPVDFISQEQQLAAGVPKTGVMIVNTPRASQKSLVDFVIEYSNIFFVAFLIFLVVSLLLNIFIKIQVQHSAMIVQTVAVIALVAAAVLLKFSFAEQIYAHILIL